MFDGNDDKKPPCTSERYAGAVSNGSTKVGNDTTLPTSGDIVLAAGMGKYRLGSALLRLASEWHSGAVPVTARTPTAKTLARDAATARVESGIAASEEEYGGMRVSDKRARRAAAPVTKHDAEFAQAEERRLSAMATDWTMQENRLRFQRMKSLSLVRSALLHWVQEKGWEDGEYLIASVLQRFLSPVCARCNGTALQVTPGTLGREVVRKCKACAGQKDKGTAKIPHGGRGKRLLEYLEVCAKTAAHDIGQGLARYHRSGANVEARANVQARQEAEKLARVDREAEADAAQDTEAVAETFRKSMGGKRMRKR